MYQRVHAYDTSICCASIGRGKGNGPVMTSVAAASAKLGEHGKVAMDCIGSVAVQQGLRVARITQEKHRNLLETWKGNSSC